MVSQLSPIKFCIDSQGYFTKPGPPDRLASLWGSTIWHMISPITSHTLLSSHKQQQQRQKQ